MLDNVKDSVTVDQLARDLAVPGTPKSTTSQINGEGLSEDLKYISDTPNRPSGRVAKNKALKSFLIYLVNPLL